MIVNHVGLRVGDVARSVRFYEALGFESRLELDLPDGATEKLTQLARPIGLRAVYLVNGPFVLELLGFDPNQHPAEPITRNLADAGLTHLSIGVDDIDAAKTAVREGGGTVIDETDLGRAVMVRDPDGQLLELLGLELRPVTP